MKYEDMSIDQLDAASVELKLDIAKLHGRRLEIAKVRAAKVEEARLEDRMKAAGLEGYTLVPKPASLAAKGN